MPAKTGDADCGRRFEIPHPVNAAALATIVRATEYHEQLDTPDPHEGVTVSQYRRALSTINSSNSHDLLN
jgi:hypothetical protein